MIKINEVNISLNESINPFEDIKPIVSYTIQINLLILIIE